MANHKSGSAPKNKSMSAGNIIFSSFRVKFVAHFHFRKIEAIETEMDMNSCILFYRWIQILVKAYNSFLRDRILPSIMLCVPGIQVVTLYVTINHHSDITMPGFLIFPLLLLNAGVTNVLGLTLASFVNSVSKRVIESLRKRASRLRGRKKSLAKRQLRACSVLKIRFKSNFIDRGTPLVVQTFCFNQTVSLILIKEGKSMRYEL